MVSDERTDSLKILITIIYIIVIGQVGFFFGLSLPRDCFDETKFPYKSFDREKSGLYAFLKVKRWKSKVPDMSNITKRIMPKKLNENITSEYMDKLVKESCVAEMIHYVLCVFAIGIYNIWKGGLGILLAVLYIVGNFPYVIIQRYNRPNYIALRDKLKLREERRANG